MMRISNAARTQAGQTLILFALALTFIIAIAGLAIEGGVAEGDRRFLQAVGDGGALAGAQRLASGASTPNVAQQQAARYAAALYVLSGLTGGGSVTLPAGCNGNSGDFGTAAHLPGTAACDLPDGAAPTSTHALYVETPYAADVNNDPIHEILVRLNHTDVTPLSSVVGVSNVSIASRSVAMVTGGGQPFGEALHVNGNLDIHGSVPTIVGGNVFVGGCITTTTGSSLVVHPVTGNEGRILVYYNVSAATLAKQPKQVWNAGAGSGNPCTAEVRTEDSLPLLASYGAGGHLKSKADWTCGPTDADSACP
jgi:Flp pilus assembly protein TadG